MYAVVDYNGKRTIRTGFEIEGMFDRSVSLSNGARILYAHDLPDMIRELGSIVSAALPDLGSECPARLEPGQYVFETGRLASIAEQCVRKDFDWLSVLPLTKTGQIPKRRSIAIAVSKYPAVTDDPSAGRYFRKTKLRLALVPAWADIAAFTRGDRSDDVFALVLDDGPATAKTPPVFGLK